VVSGTAVVVGAGVGGLATAIGLRRAGWRTSVLERRPELEHYGAAFALHPPAQDALDRLGVGEAVIRRAVPYRGARIRTPDGRVLASLPMERIERRYGRPELLVPRSHLIDVLLAELAAFGDVPLVLGSPVTDPGPLLAEHDLLVGADGINSAVRTAALGTRSGPRTVGTAVWVGTADFEDGVYGETWGPGRFFGLTPVEPGRTNWYAAVPAADAGTPLADLFGDWHDPVPRALAATGAAARVRYEMRHLYPALPSFVHGGRTALVGDAAHAMTPNLGQGACTASLDADALTRAVAAHGPAGLPAALRAYDRERRRSAQRTAFGARTLHRLVSTRHTRLRDAVARLMPG
jgi:2-polyprenyl-6-methoxyphenol hydroxylase-like FAD-dependent oxidoreductase